MQNLIKRYLTLGTLALKMRTALFVKSCREKTYMTTENIIMSITDFNVSRKTLTKMVVIPIES